MRQFEIIKFFHIIAEIRSDFLISYVLQNFLSQAINLDEHHHHHHSPLKKYIEKGHFLPCVMSPGYKNKPFVKKKFQEINQYNLDQMIGKPVLPIILYLFLQSESYQLENQAIQLIEHCFS